MSTIEESIEVEVPVSTAYNQWTQFESFPNFMDGVEEVRQLSDTSTHWTVSIGGVTREFDAEITEQTPDQRIAWRSVEGTGHAGVVTFHKLDDGVTKVMLQIDTEPEGLVEKAGDAIGIPRRDAKADLRNFKQFIEKRGQETGAWRGDVEQDS
ncbi:MAG: SRPBCC family protein [Frankiaceae bacterium]|nr:SRPBCC family protein [Frankiaceae bacterium]MBV9870852.1 SRPBCC family protein [Frankiaceae bacterium]